MIYYINSINRVRNPSPVLSHGHQVSLRGTEALQCKEEKHCGVQTARAFLATGFGEGYQAGSLFELDL